MPLVLAGDIGGTKTLLALYEVAAGGACEQRLARYESAAFAGLEPMLRAFLGGSREPIAFAGFGVAGPVLGDVCETTNIPWRIDARRVAQEVGTQRVRLINDFHAVALGISALAPGDTVILQEGSVDPHGAAVVIGAGTGLGQAVLVPGDGAPRVLASEGGHCDFAPRGDVEIELLRFLMRRHSHVSWERAVSGAGLVALYEFAVERGLGPELPETRERMSREDPAAVVTDLALDRTDTACVGALDSFLSLYGAEAGNLALKVLATGGVYIAGGIAPRMVEEMKTGPFLRAFRDKGRRQALLETFRVSLVVQTHVGLYGARIAATAP